MPDVSLYHHQEFLPAEAPACGCEMCQTGTVPDGEQCGSWFELDGIEVPTFIELGTTINLRCRCGQPVGGEVSLGPGADRTLYVEPCRHCMREASSAAMNSQAIEQKSAA